MTDLAAALPVGAQRQIGPSGGGGLESFESFVLEEPLGSLDLPDEEEGNDEEGEEEEVGGFSPTTALNICKIAFSVAVFPTL